jgi:hypothetical protein
MANLKQLGMASSMYAQRNDDRLPLRANWMDALKPFTMNDQIARCPSVNGLNQFGYAFNSTLDSAMRAHLADPGRMPLVYDSTNLVRNASDPFTSLATKSRHSGPNVVFADGLAHSVSH